MWWPEITVDVIKSDLVLTPSFAVEADEEEEVCEWTVKKSEAPLKDTKFDLVRTLLQDGKRRIERIRFDLAMATFHALALQEGADLSDIASPLDFCTPSSSSVVFPSAAADFEQYQSLLAQTDIFSFCIADEVAKQNLLPPKYQQDVKDLQRDSVCINGQFFCGAECGYEAILAHLVQLVGEPASRALSIANRTFSGGVAFDQVMRCFASDGIVAIAPLSAEAEPLDIVVVPKRGILIRAQTKYALVAESHTDEIACSINACTLVELFFDSFQDPRAFVLLDKVVVYRDYRVFPIPPTSTLQ